MGGYRAARRLHFLDGGGREIYQCLLASVDNETPDPVLPVSLRCFLHLLHFCFLWYLYLFCLSIFFSQYSEQEKQWFI